MDNLPSFFEIQLKERGQRGWDTYYWHDGDADESMFPTEIAAMQWLSDHEEGRNLFADFKVRITGYRSSMGRRLKCTTKVMLLPDASQVVPVEGGVSIRDV